MNLADAKKTAAGRGFLASTEPNPEQWGNHRVPARSQPLSGRFLSSPVESVIEVVFETHSITEDNEIGIATGWNQGLLSKRGRQLAKELGMRRRNDNLAAVFTSNLGRAVETATIAFEGAATPILHDWRLRECNYGEWNGRPSNEVHGDRMRFLDTPYPGGESWRQATDRVVGFFEDLHPRWDGKRVLLIGHIATRWGCDRFLKGMPLEELISEEFVWQEGWEYSFDAG